VHGRLIPTSKPRPHHRPVTVASHPLATATCIDTPAFGRLAWGFSTSGGIVAIRGIAAADGRTSRRPRLTLLNAFTLSVAGEAVHLPLSAQRILVFVALHDHPVQRPYVACSLWLDSPEERAHANLRSALWRIHKRGVRLVNAVGNQLCLDREVLVDLREAEALARRIADPGHEVSERDTWILSRDLLPDWYEDWVVFERERYRQLRLHALELLCERLTEAGRLEEALQAGLAAVSAEPLRETAHRAVIRTHLAEGNASEAIRQFELCRRLLHEQLGVEPSERMHELIRNLRVPETVR
jgi:DNA-binding SARP family transcriptional activator